MICPICEQGNLTEKIEYNTIVHNEQVVPVKTYYSTCDFCGSDQANYLQIKKNKEEVDKLK